MGTDALVGSWLFLLSSVLYVYYAVVLVERALYGDKSRAYVPRQCRPTRGMDTIRVSFLFFLTHNRVSKVSMLLRFRTMDQRV